VLQGLSFCFLPCEDNLHTVEVVGSNPIPPTTHKFSKLWKQAWRSAP